MEFSILSDQISQFKTLLVNEINNELSKINERVLFHNSYYFIKKNEPHIVYLISGIENGHILLDNFIIGNDTLSLIDLPIEALVFIKTQLYYYQSNKIVKDQLA